MPNLNPGDEVLRRFLWRAQQHTVNARSGDPLAVVTERTLQEMYKQYPNMRPADAIAAMRQLTDAYRRKYVNESAERAKSQLDRLSDLLGLAADIPGADPRAQFAVKAAQLTWKTFGAPAFADKVTQLNAQTSMSQTYNDWQHAYPRAEQTFDLSLQMATATDNEGRLVYPGYAQTRDALLGAPNNGAPIYATVDELLAQPDLADLYLTTQIFDEVGRLRTDVDVLKAIKDDVLPKLADSLKDLRGEAVSGFGAVIAQQGDFAAYIQDQQRAEQVAKTARDEARLRDVRLAAAKSAVSIITSVVGIEDPKLAHQIEVVASAGIYIAETVSHFAETAAELGKAAVGLASVVATGNILGAALSVVNLFAEAGPSEVALLHDDVKAMREELGAFRSQVSERFDRVDRQLTAVLDLSLRSFQSINDKFDAVQGGIGNLQREVATVQRQLSRLEAGMTELAGDLARQELHLKLLETLQHEQNFGAAMKIEDFRGAVAFFVYWGTDASHAAFAVGPTRPSAGLRLSDLALELSAPLYTNIALLIGYLHHLGLDLPVAEDLPNPMDWALAREAYTQLMRENPSYAVTLSADMSRRLDQPGEKLQYVLGSIFFQMDSGGAITGRKLVVDKLTNLYEGQVEDLFAKLQQEYEAYKSRRGIDPLSEPHAPLPEILDPGVEREPIFPTELPVQAVRLAGGDLSPVIPFPMPSAIISQTLHAPAIRAAHRLYKVTPRLKASAWLSPTKVRTDGSSETVRIALRISAEVDLPDHTQPVTYASWSFIAPEAEAFSPRAPGPDGRYVDLDVIDVLQKHWSGLQHRIAFDGFGSRGEYMQIYQICAASFRREFATLYGTLADIVEGDPNALDTSSAAALHESAMGLTGAAYLWRDAVALGLPTTFDQNEYVHALLVGGVPGSGQHGLPGRLPDERLLTHESLALWFRGAASLIDATAGDPGWVTSMPYRGQWYGPLDLAKQRNATLKRLVDQGVDAVVAGAVRSTHPLLERAFTNARAVVREVSEPGIDVVPNVAEFPETVVGASSGAVEIRIRNPSSSASLRVQCRVEGAAEADYVTDPTPVEVGPGVVHLHLVAFHPTVAGERAATLVIENNALAGFPIGVDLLGFGL